MRGIELACVAIVASYVAMRLRGAGDKGAIVRRLACLAFAAWLGEDSVIRAYGFYGYAPSWSIFVDRVPLLVVAIWPVVIDSAHALAKHVASTPSKIAIATAAIVLADASLIEPIAVRAGLWSWSADVPRPLFDVPLVGVAGWAYFAWGAAIAFEATRVARASARDAAAVIAAPIAAHALLIATWWGFFKWLTPAELAPMAPALAAWIACVPVARVAFRDRDAIPTRVVLARAPGAAFFFALLGLARAPAPLVAYALAFAPPYLAALAKRAPARAPARHG